MTALLAITGPIYLIVAIGYLCVRAGWFAKADLKVLGLFVLRVALPALIFNAVSSKTFTDILQPQYLLVFTAASLITLGLGLAWARWVRGCSPSQAGIIGMGMICPNSGYVGFPIALLTLPAVAGMGLALNMLVENLLTRKQAGLGSPGLDELRWLKPVYPGDGHLLFIKPRDNQPCKVRPAPQQNQPLDYRPILYLASKYAQCKPREPDQSTPTSVQKTTPLPKHRR